MCRCVDERTLVRGGWRRAAHVLLGDLQQVGTAEAGEERRHARLRVGREPRRRAHQIAYKSAAGKIGPPWSIRFLTPPCGFARPFCIATCGPTAGSACAGL